MQALTRGTGSFRPVLLDVGGTLRTTPLIEVKESNRLIK